MTTAAAGCKTYAQTSSLSFGSPPQQPHLPCDIVEEILCRLPVKHLLPLCCVCKSWNSLISHDSKFAKKHLSFSHDHHHHRLALQCSREFRILKSPISSLFSSEVVPSFDSFTQLNNLLNKYVYGYDRDRGSTCHGMLCFSTYEFLALLCNPSTGKFKLLPPLNNSYVQTIYTLVYDRFIHHYKIIALSSLCKGKKQVNVYTLGGTNDWRKIQDFPDHYYCSNLPGIFVSDTVNWLIYDTCSKSNVIVSLSLEKESYQQFLHSLYHESPLVFHNNNILGTLRDCLCFFYHTNMFSDIWIMKEYGNEKSWIKVLKVPYIGDPGGWYGHTKPLYIYEDDRVLMRFKKMNKFILAVYDSKNNTFKTHQIQNSVGIKVFPKVYVESLISPY